MGYLSDLKVAADDVVCSLEETFTRRREKSLDIMRRKIGTLIDDLSHGQAIYRAVAQSVEEVTSAVTGLQSQFNLAITPTLPSNIQTEDIRPLAINMAKYVEKAIKISNWGLTAYQYLFMGTLYARHGSAIAQHMVQVSEATVLGTIGHAAANSRLMIRSGTMGNQTAQLTKIGRWVETVGSVATVANGIIVIIDVVMGARKIAVMRSKVEELKTSLRTLEAEVAKLDKGFTDLADAGNALYLAVVGDAGDSDGEAWTATINGMFKKIRNLPQLLSGDPMANKQFHDLRVDLNQDNIRTRTYLLGRVQQQLIDLRLWQGQVETACRMLVDGIAIDRLQRTLPKLSPALLGMLAAYVTTTTGDSRFKPHITSDANGQISIRPLTDDVAE